MKKLLLLLFVASFGIAGSATAQKKSNKNCGNDKNKYSKKYDRRNDDRWDRNNGTYNNKYSSNAPRRVRDAFNRDYPNVSNVTWTKDRGVWTANFRRSGLFGGNSNVSYTANGERLGSNYNNRTARSESNKRPSGIFGNNNF